MPALTTPEPGGRWRDVARATGLLAADGTVAATVFAEMSALAARTGAINLGQGFPDVDGPDHVKDAAVRALRAGHNQYPPGAGIPELREAIAAHQSRHYGLALDPDTQVLVTTGATEALAAAVLALAGPGDEVVTLEPFYDSYAAVIALAGATHRTIPLRPDPSGFRLDERDVIAAVGPRTRLIILNSPHNPTGAVLGLTELAWIAHAAQTHDALVVTDEVYEHLTYDGAEHVPITTLPGMGERTITVSSAGKTLSFTGWKIGWAHGPAELITAVRTVKQFLTYVSGAPFQPAVAAALDDPDGATAAYVSGLRDSLQTRRDLLVEALWTAGFAPVTPQGAYYVVADARGVGYDDAVTLCRRLPERAGIVAIPVTAFATPGGQTARELASWVRFTFVKSQPLLREAARRLAALRR